MLLRSLILLMPCGSAHRLRMTVRLTTPALRQSVGGQRTRWSIPRSQQWRWSQSHQRERRHQGSAQRSLLQDRCPLSDAAQYCCRPITRPRGHEQMQPATGMPDCGHPLPFLIILSTCPLQRRLRRACLCVWMLISLRLSRLGPRLTNAGRPLSLGRSLAFHACRTPGALPRPEPRSRIEVLLRMMASPHYPIRFQGTGSLPCLW